MSDLTRDPPPTVVYTAEVHQGCGPVEFISFDIRRGQVIPAELCGVMAQAAREAGENFLARLAP